MTINYPESIICNIFCNWKSSCPARCASLIHTMKGSDDSTRHDAALHSANRKSYGIRRRSAPQAKWLNVIRGESLNIMLLTHHWPCILGSLLEMWTVTTPLSVSNSHCEANWAFFESKEVSISMWLQTDFLSIPLLVAQANEGNRVSELSILGTKHKFSSLFKTLSLRVDNFLHSSRPTLVQCLPNPFLLHPCSGVGATEEHKIVVHRRCLSKPTIFHSANMASWWRSWCILRREIVWRTTSLQNDEIYHSLSHVCTNHVEFHIHFPTH